ncbi:hypothetical protein O181_014575 [Austropuccinia psidii MF-1]|uniref:DUF4939 domain-containing protein n=1 Tax=Austropuccinia psidii MF-1 TaxID=1389203 RepID=A0A9Q3C180_9BASI|nr:hypothetical protein [Austropuccinia psidii MF-1]
MWNTTFKGLGEDCEEEEDSKDTEVVPAILGASNGTGGPNSTQYNNPVSHLYDPSILVIMKKMTQIMANIQAASSSQYSKPLAFKSSSMKAPDCFDGTKPFKVRYFIQFFQLIFHNDQENLSDEKKKFLYATSFLIGRATKWIESYLSNLTNQDPAYHLSKCHFLNPYSSPYLETQMKSEKLKQSWYP